MAMTDMSDDTPRSNRPGGGERSLLRVAATLLLIPSVPMLLASIGALALFYAAPTRFGRLIERLPGDEFIRSALVFAPATLFAVVVLAVLYARQIPRPAARPATIPAFGDPWQLAASVCLLISITGLLISSAILALAFAAPARFEQFIEPLPGTRYLNWLVRLAPPAFLGLLVSSTLFLLVRRGAASTRAVGLDWSRLPVRAARLAVGVTLAISTPLLVVSLGALLVYRLSPVRILAAIHHVPLETLIRLGMIFSPAILLALVILTMIYLRATSGSRMVNVQVSTPSHSGRPNPLRATVAAGVLLSGLMFTSALILGAVGAAAYLLVR
jgi:hypothetical protein